MLGHCSKSLSQNLQTPNSMAFAKALNPQTKDRSEKIMPKMLEITAYFGPHTSSSFSRQPHEFVTKKINCNTPPITQQQTKP